MVTAVVDTNVLISALIGHGKFKRLLIKLFRGRTIVPSTQMLAELADVLSRKKFAEVKGSQVNQFLSILTTGTVLVTIKRLLEIVAEDPDDNMVLSTAYEGGAEYIVSGDKHLLDLKDFKGIRIVTVNEMLELLHS
jgi:putative PIN family toxin of toxin-antitoxin system